MLYKYISKSVSLTEKLHRLHLKTINA